MFSKISKGNRGLKVGIISRSGSETRAGVLCVTTLPRGNHMRQAEYGLEPRTPFPSLGTAQADFAVANEESAVKVKNHVLDESEGL